MRELLVKNGWTQNRYRSQEGAFCLAGAIRYVYAFSTDFDGRLELHARLERLLAKRGAADPQVPSWNDEPGRTKKQVLELLRSVEKGYGKA